MKTLLKALLVAFLSVPLTALSDTIATMPNNAGGEMHFTDAQCSSRGKNWFVVYSMTKHGNSIFGCWMLIDSMVHVVWDGGQTSAFYVNNLTLRKSNKNNGYNY